MNEPLKTIVRQEVEIILSREHLAATLAVVDTPIGILNIPNQRRKGTEAQSLAQLFAEHIAALNEFPGQLLQVNILRKSQRRRR